MAPSVLYTLLVVVVNVARGLRLDAGVSVGLELYTVAPQHQDALVEAVAAGAQRWATRPQFRAAAVHRSLDGVRVFAYSQWDPAFDHRRLVPELPEFFVPESHSLVVTKSASRDDGVDLTVDDKKLTHLAEFRMPSEKQPAMIEKTSAALDEAMAASPGLLSATFHRSLDGTRIFNLGQWTSKDAFEELEKQPGFSKKDPYWAGLARNEFHLYDLVAVL